MLMLALWCSCGHQATVPLGHTLYAIPKGGREAILLRYRCANCGRHPNDMRIYWRLEEHAR